ncbi:MAG: hypothetical protein ACRC2T_08855 [Thermoguttaceae bacterium]
MSKIEWNAKPSKEVVEYWWKKYSDDAALQAQDTLIDTLFSKTWKQKECTKYGIEFVRVRILNDFFSTSITRKVKISAMAKHIAKLNTLEKRMERGDVSVVNDIAKCLDATGILRSFATKYAHSFCRANDIQDENERNPYPIYDSKVRAMLMYFKKHFSFAKFTGEGLEEYATFKKVMDAFRDAFGLQKYTTEQIDKYLWLAGKAKPPR